MLPHWFPWKTLVRRTARVHGFFDPLTLLAQLRQFAQPSEVAEPIELLREGIKFHARGLVNTKAIQHNLDWVWPYWIEKQFNPLDPSFIPRGFSFSHINLTHRDWTAVGLPNRMRYAIVDPRGLVTPFNNGWSLDFWLETSDGFRLVPSRSENAWQRLNMEDGLSVSTRIQEGAIGIFSRVWVEEKSGRPVLFLSVEGRAPRGGTLIAALRPYNPEGVQFIHKIRFHEALDTWRVDDAISVVFMDRPDATAYSNYAEGDVFAKIPRGDGQTRTDCKVGMATAAAFFSIDSGETRRIELRLPMKEDRPSIKKRGPGAGDADWPSARKETARLTVPDEQVKYLYDAAVSTLLLLSGEEVVPGPFTYRRFWFRDACFMLNALLAIGSISRCRAALRQFPGRQRQDGYFQSQNGEWDSNGQVLWIFDRFQQLSGEDIDEPTMASLLRGAKWIHRKRTPPKTGTLHAGLLPAGFSAEHFGPNDYYYWDDFWALGGLRSLIRLTRGFGPQGEAERIEAMYTDLRDSIFSSIESIPERRRKGGIPASPYRRMDSGAVGSLVADYPLQLTAPGDPRIMNTVNDLMDRCFVNGAFFQDMVHSGLNAYLTLAIAQTLLRAGDKRYAPLVRQVAGMASPTGQWPEAIHPATGGGCMGDGQHGWAAAEWVMMIRNLFVREENGGLIIGSGIFRDWINGGQEVEFGPSPTPCGPVSVRIEPRSGQPSISVTGIQRDRCPKMEIAVPGYRPIVDVQPDQTYELKT
ncbi:MAG: hypothetical protein ACOWWM_19850 [Desulfobacterales bacterium]